VSRIDVYARFWNAMDELIADVVRHSWGAVVTRPASPALWDVNYARVDTRNEGLDLASVEAAARPALRAAGASRFHVVMFHPDATSGLLTELSTRGDRLSWDVAMAHAGTPPPRPRDVEVEELGTLSEGFWGVYRRSLPEFGEPVPASEADQLETLERTAMLVAGKRWFVVREAGGRIVALASLLLTAGSGYIDHVVTFRESRGRGYASAITARIVHEARDAGADEVFLFVDPDGPRALYARLGFSEIGRVASTLAPIEGGPLPDDQAGGATRSSGGT
jgi:ribosomal protein S18 acetylase RimI-like enzyme